MLRSEQSDKTWVNIMAAEAQTPCAPRPSAVMVLIMQDKWLLVFHQSRYYVECENVFMFSANSSMLRVKIITDSNSVHKPWCDSQYIAADDLVTQGARASAAIVLTQFSISIPTLTPQQLSSPWTRHWSIHRQYLQKHFLCVCQKVRKG